MTEAPPVPRPRQSAAPGGPPAPLVLASASPRRHRLLEGLGLRFEWLAAEVVESHAPGDPIGSVVDNALAKHAAVRLLRPHAHLISADTLVWIDGRLIGKPADLAEAAQMLRRLAGRCHSVCTAVALARPGQARPDLRIEASRVRFKPLDDATIAGYLELEHPLDRAGAYDIDSHGAMLVAGHDGSFSNIMGLPIESVRDWLQHNLTAAELQALRRLPQEGEL